MKRLAVKPSSPDVLFSASEDGTIRYVQSYKTTTDVALQSGLAGGLGCLVSRLFFWYFKYHQALSNPIGYYLVSFRFVHINKFGYSFTANDNSLLEVF